VENNPVLRKCKLLGLFWKGSINLSNAKAIDVPFLIKTARRYGLTFNMEKPFTNELIFV